MSDETNDVFDDGEISFEFESEQHLPVAAVARRLREVAEGVEAGALQVGGHAVNPTSPVKFEEEYSAESTDEGIAFELELELKWRWPHLTDRRDPTGRSTRTTAHQPRRGKPGWRGSSSCSRTSPASSGFG